MNKHILIILLSLISPMAMAQDKSAIDSLLRRYAQPGAAGASLLIIQNGKKVYQKAYGLSDTENKVPVRSQTNFRLASVSKQFTAAATLMLINEGKFHLSTTLPELFEGFPAYGKNITVKHLLNHTSGIADYENYVADTAMNPQIKDAGALDIVMKLDTVYFKPGNAYRYSNTAYALLAMAIEKYSGQTFARFLEQRIFKPLGMHNTVAYEKGLSEVKNRAYGHAYVANNWQRRDQSSTSAVLGDGGIYSSVEDMYKWDQALYGNTKLKGFENPPASGVFSYNRLNDGKEIAYGFGWHLKKAGTEQVVYHTGSTTSFRNIFYRIPSQQFSIILLTNRNRPEETDMVGLAEKILEAWKRNN